MSDVGVFPHRCERYNCSNTVQYDDEPFCFTHSPDSGSSVRGYSAREKARLAEPTRKDAALEQLVVEEEMIDIQLKINELTDKRNRLSEKKAELEELIHLAKKYGYTLI